MSMQSARDFIKKIEADRTLKERLEAAADMEARQKIVRAGGFDFTLEEFKLAAQELAAAAGRELTPDELLQVAGGTGRSGWCPGHCSSECSCHGGIGAVM